jgi:hypothetical protein
LSAFYPGYKVVSYDLRGFAHQKWIHKSTGHDRNAIMRNGAA